MAIESVGPTHQQAVAEDARLPLLRCVASTGDKYRCTVEQSHPGWAESVYGAATPSDKHESNCFRHALLSPDGAAVVTYNEDLMLRTFAVPSTHETNEFRNVQPYCTSSSPLKLSSLALHPAFDICNAASTLLLTAQPDLPLRLTNALDLTYTHASYKWQNAMTEAFVAPTSLLFTDSTRFVAGARDTIAIFDIHHSDGPLQAYPTRKGRKARKMYGSDAIGISGLVSALAVSVDGILAAGSTGRQVGWFDNAGQGERITAFDLRGNDAEDITIKGNGVSQLAWSPCGRYLFIAERQSDALLVYDVRSAGQRLCYLSGRRARTTQKLSFDMATNSDGDLDVWAGGTDGKVRIWRSVTARQGCLDPDVALHASEAAVSNTILSRREPMLITTSGQRRSPKDLLDTDLSDPDLDRETSDNSSSGSESESAGEDNKESGDSISNTADEADSSEPVQSATMAAEHAWRGPAFDNVLAFWQIM